MGRFIDLTGRRFARLLVLDRAGISKNRGVMWKCLCDCGNIVVTQGWNIRAGKSKSCGCLRNEIASVVHKGRALSEEQNLSKLHKGKIVSKETRQKLSEANKGKKHTEESKRKMSKAHKGSKSYRWNPNREEVLANKKIRKFMYVYIQRIVSDKTGRRTEELYGYTCKELKNHITSKLLSGWTWKNYGKVWNIDHIKPVSAFIKEGMADPKIINALDNLQPLSVKDNLRKGSKYDCI